MIPLFSAEGNAALEALARRSTLYGFDFDGTLAPIVMRPEDAVASDNTLHLLSTLGALVPVAVITGRSVADARRHLEFTPLHLVGNHGAEGLPSPLHRSLANSLSASGGNPLHRLIAQAWLAQWPAAIGPEAEQSGIFIEDKTYSLSVHYRRALDREAARHAVVAAIAKLDPAPQRIGGKFVINLLPEGAPDKGFALAELVRFEECDTAFYIGDDVTDERIFATAPSHWVTVRVGQSADSAARFYIDEQVDIDACLDRLVRAVTASADRASRRAS